MMRNPIATQGECQPKSVTGDKQIITRQGVITISNMNYHQAITPIPISLRMGRNYFCYHQDSIIEKIVP